MRQLIGDFFEQYDSEYVPVVSGYVSWCGYRVFISTSAVESVRDRYQYGM